MTAGWIRSTSPRLVNASRILLFHTIWTLVGTSSIREVGLGMRNLVECAVAHRLVAMLQFTSDRFLHLFYPTLWSALLSIISLVIGHSILPPERKRLNDILGEALKGLADGIRGRGVMQNTAPRRPRTLSDGGPDGVEEEREDESNESTTPTAYSPPAQIEEGREAIDEAERAATKPKYRPLVSLLPIIREHYSTALHGITYDPMSTRRLRPILTILYTHIGRNPVVKDLAKNTSGEFSFQLQSGNGKEQLKESLDGIRELISLAIEDALRSIREAYDWHQDDSDSRKNLGGPLGFWQNHVVSHKTRSRKAGEPADPRRRLASSQESLLNATWTYEHDLLTWLETGFFSQPKMGRAITEREMKELSSRDIARMLFKRDKVRGRRGNHTEDSTGTATPVDGDVALSKEDIAKAQEERVKAAAWLVAILDVSEELGPVVLQPSDLLLVCRAACKGRQLAL